MVKRSRVLVILILGIILGSLITGFGYLIWLGDGNSGIGVQIINDRDYFPAVLESLEDADTSIHIAMFSITYYDKYEDSHINQFLEELVRADMRGIDVKILVDNFPVDIEKGVDYLARNGVDVKYVSESQTTHAKLIVIDSEKVILGSSNWRYYSVDKNHEANVIIYSEDVARDYETYFRGIWEES